MNTLNNEAENFERRNEYGLWRSVDFFYKKKILETVFYLLSQQRRLSKNKS